MKSTPSSSGTSVSPSVNRTADPSTPGLRKRWFYLLPVVFVTYSLAYLDRANYGFGAAAGLAETLHITPSQSALLGSLFFFGYFLFQIPGATYARTRSATRLVFISLLVWGALAAATGLIRNFWLLALDRMALGIAEALIFPAMLLLLTNWFTRKERSRANTLLILGNPITILWMSAITGYLIRAVGWQMTFVIEGVPSILWAVFWISLVRDKPSQSKWMDAESVSYLNTQLELEQRSVPKVASVRKALLRPDVLLLCIQYFCWSIGLYGFVLWLPTMIRQGAAIGIETTGLLSAVPYLLAIILLILNSQRSDRTLRRRVHIWPFLIISGVALLGSFLLANHSFWLAYTGLILAGGTMYAPYGPFWALIPEIVPKNVTAEVLAGINSCGALGAFVGSWFVGLLQARTGNSRAGYLLMAISLIVSGIMILFLPNTPAASTDREDLGAMDRTLLEQPQLNSTPGTL